MTAAIEQGGKRAALSGAMLESQIENMLNTKGYAKITTDLIDSNHSNAWFVRQHRGFHSIYEKTMRIDFFLHHPVKWAECLAVEVKWQESGGSVDEKYPYLVANFKQLEMPSAVFIAGNGYSPHSLKWLMAQQTDTFTVIESMDNILKWASRNL